MLAAVAAGVSHPAVAALLGLGAAALAGVVVAMAWNVHVRQLRLAELLARRQFIVTAPAEEAGQPVNGNGTAAASVEKAAWGAAAAVERAARGAAAGAARGAAAGAARGAAGAAPAVVIDGPETVVTGAQARYRVRPAGDHNAVSWAVGGGSVSQSPDPSHPDELLLIADRPGDLTIIARVREGMAERRATKPVTAVLDVTDPAPPFTLRLFVQGWGLVVVAVLTAGFAGALVALGSLAPSDFIALAVPLAALLGVVTMARGTGDAPGRPGKGAAGPRP
jgi:hypothetical protein